jgi:hypothetical protein
MTYPDDLIGLCKTFMVGEDFRYALHDLLVELGYPLCAKEHFRPHNCTPGDSCDVVSAVLTGTDLSEMESRGGLTFDYNTVVKIQDAMQKLGY